MTKLTNTQMIEVLANALKEAQEDIETLKKELKLVKGKLKKYENKTIGGFNSYLSPRDMGITDETDY